MRIRLHNLTIPGQESPKDILIADGLFADIAASPDHSSPSDLTLSLAGAIAFPGLINSHDHLDFNLFPRLGNAIYPNYTEWGRDIHLRNRKEIDEVLEIPQPLRTTWGIYKNLLNGFTTVVNHGEILPVDDDLITVFKDQQCLHSVGFGKSWRWHLNHPGWRRPSPHGPGRRPVVIHVGEGTDKAAHHEIDRLLRWNLFNRPLIGIHGVAMDETQAKGFHALVWCPASNYFLLDATAPIHKLKDQVRILFGTDSTLTAPWDAWEHIRLARQQPTMQLTDKELLDALTRQAADTWQLPAGKIAPGCQADLVVSAATEVFNTTPEDILLVLHKGQIRLFDASLDIRPRPGFSKISVGERNKYVKGDLPGLMKKIREHHPAVAFPDTVGYAVTPFFF